MLQKFEKIILKENLTHLMANKNGTKADVEKNWCKAKNFTPAKNEIIIYEPDEEHNYYRVKVGNGADNVTNLPFVTNDTPTWQYF